MTGATFSSSPTRRKATSRIRRQRLPADARELDWIARQDAKFRGVLCICGDGAPHQVFVGGGQWEARCGRDGCRKAGSA